MNSVRFILSILLISYLGNSAVAQSYEEELGFTFVKAKYLLETDRYDDAVREFNRVINDDPSLENALALRAFAKYKLSAYIGTKKDVLKYIELKGVTPEAVSLLAKAEYQLTEFDAALNSLTTAISLVNDDPELYEFRAAIYLDRDEKLKACADWESAAKMGSSKALVAAQRNCGYQEVSSEPSIDDGGMLVVDSEVSGDPSTIIISEEDKVDTVNSNITKTPNEGPIFVGERQNNTENSSYQIPNDSSSHALQTASLDTLASSEVIIPKEPEIDPRLLDNSINIVGVDEDLTLHISGQGLGSRTLVRQPNILILSDEEGDVVIDVCVSRGGRVIDATFNESGSTLLRKSLVSLAIRKAKDFWFEKSDLIEQCGEIRFKIKGS